MLERCLCLRNSSQENNAQRCVHLFDKGFLFHHIFLVKRKESETKTLFTFQLSSLLCFQGGTGSHSAPNELKPRKYFYQSRVTPCTENLPLICCQNREMIFWILCCSGGIPNLSRTCWHFKSPPANCRGKQCIQCHKSRLHLWNYPRGKTICLL